MFAYDNVMHMHASYDAARRMPPGSRSAAFEHGSGGVAACEGTAMLCGCVQVLLTPQEAALHVLLSSTIAEMTKAMANDSAPSGLSPSQPAQLTSPDTQAKLQLM